MIAMPPTTANEMLTAPGVAEMLGVSVDVIRRLPQDGSVPPAKRLSNRHRYYTAQDIERIRAALAASGRLPAEAEAD
jgi:DNA-binding transcriptional MerR regulator